MKRVFQDLEGEITFIKGKTVAQLLGVMFRNKDTDELNPCIFWLKMAEEDHWNRFSVDEVCATWDIYPSLDQDDLDETEDFPVFDLGKMHSLVGTKVESIVAEVSELNGKPCVRLRIAFVSGQKLVVSESNEKSKMEIISP